MALEDATNPLAGTSGPGSFSKRTDLQYQPDQYGQGVEMAAIKAGAPLASSPGVNGATNTDVRQAAASAAQQATPARTQGGVTSLYAQSNRPHEPITHGIASGPGAGPEALNINSQFAQEKLSNTLAQMLPYDSTGEIAILYQQALARGT